MRPGPIPFAIVAALLCLGPAARADVVVLADGRRVEGEVVEATPTVVVLDTGVGQVTFARADVVDIIYRKTTRQIYEEKAAAAKSAADWFALGEWCLANKLQRKAPGCFQKTLELNPEHEGAHLALGHVRHEGEWMTPEERARRIEAVFEAEMRAKGLVRFEDRWVTPEEKENLEKGWVLHEGRWMPPGERMRLLGYERVSDRWVHASEARAREGVAAAAAAAGRPFACAVSSNALVAGPVPHVLLEEIAVGLDRGRLWFDATFGTEPGLALLGGRLAEFYVFVDDVPYERTVGHFSGVGAYLPEGWADAARSSPGFYFHQPILLSSARSGYRAELDLRGHCYQHLGHLLLNALDRNGRLLPPWWDEGVACLTEYQVHGKNRVFTRGGETASSGTRSVHASAEFDSARLRDGEWRALLSRELETGHVAPLRELCGLHFSELEACDAAAAMGIVEWVASFGPVKLRAFHRALRAGQPAPPLRIDPDRARRFATYDAALTALCGRGLAAADKEWRAWFLTR